MRQDGLTVSRLSRAYFLWRALMQSHPGAARTMCNDAQAEVINRDRGIFSFCGLGSEKPVLLGPVERQIELGQARRSKLDRLPALQDRLDDRRALGGDRIGARC